MWKRELVALLNLSSWCLVMVERLFLAVPRGLSVVCDCGISWSYSLTYIGGWCQNKTFSEYRHVAYQIKADDVCNNMVAITFSIDTPSTQVVGSKGQTISFCESSHVAYQIKGNWAQSNMKANILSLHTPTTPEVESKGHLFFRKVVMLHIEFKWKKCRPTCKVTLWINTHTWPLGLGRKVIYWNCVDVSIYFLLNWAQKHTLHVFVMIWMIPKVNFMFRWMGFVFCYLHVSQITLRRGI